MNAPSPRDALARPLRDLRLSVIEACNFRCPYCMPAERIADDHGLDAASRLSFDEIEALARGFARLGVRKLRLTGGEPLLRKRLPELVARLARIDGIDDLALTTNGSLLAAHAHALRDAGLKRITVSLDTLDPDAFRVLSGGRGELRAVLVGIEAATAAGFGPIKLNCVVQDSPDEPDARGVAAYARQEGLEVRYIRRMNLEIGDFSVVIGGSGGDCARCNRLRLSCDGMIRPCLFCDTQFSVRELGARKAILQAVEAKPLCGQTSRGRFNSIGG